MQKVQKGVLMLMSPEIIEVFIRKMMEETFLKARLFSYAELSFLKAEAAEEGWGLMRKVINWHGVQGNLWKFWGVGDTYSDYITNTGGCLRRTLDIIYGNKKWIANMFKWGRAYIGLEKKLDFPDLKAGPFAREDVMPF